MSSNLKRQSEEESHEAFRKAYDEIISLRIINRRALSIKLTGSPHRIRHDFVPEQFVDLVNKLEKSVNQIINNYCYEQITND